MTEAEYTELKQKEAALYADFQIKKDIADKAGQEWMAVAHLIETEDRRREILADMKAKGEIPA